MDSELLNEPSRVPDSAKSVEERSRAGILHSLRSSKDNDSDSRTSNTNSSIFSEMRVCEIDGLRSRLAA